MSKGKGSTQFEDEDVEITKSSYFKEAPDINKMPSYKLVDKLTIKDMLPFLDSKKYSIAHGEANFWERKEFPKGFDKLKQLDNKITNNDLVGANDPKGKLYVSKIVPESLRKEVAYHEWVESLVRKELRK